MKKKMLILNDLHFGESRDSTSNPGVIRQANSQAKETFTALIPHLTAISPDVVLHLGDALRDTYKKEIDTQNTKEAVELVTSLGFTTIHTLGNHELRAFSLDEITSLYHSVVSDVAFYGILPLGEIQLVWLDLALDKNNAPYLPQERLEWLKNDVPKDVPTLIFSHYSLVPIDPAGSFYFANQPEGMYYQNHQEITKALNALNVSLCVNAHVHLLSYQEVDGVHYISSPAFTENIAAEKFPQNNPAVYSVLEVGDTSFVFTSYSGSFCFAKIQGKL